MTRAHISRSFSLAMLGLASLLVTSGAFLSGCTEVRDRLGIDPEVPDEFTVLERAPLYIPPNFPLRPPLNEGETAAVAPSISASDEAKRVLLGGQESPRVAKRSSGQDALLQKAGSSDDNIRKSIDDDISVQTQTSKKVIRNLLEPAPARADVSLDPVAEKARLEAARQAPTPAELVMSELNKNDAQAHAVQDARAHELRVSNTQKKNEERRQMRSDQQQLMRDFQRNQEQGKTGAQNSSMPSDALVETAPQ